MGRLTIKKHSWTRIEDEASPHIESRLKTLKKHCDAITDMKDASGIEWRTTDRTLICYDDDVWEDWVKDHSDAKGLRNKPFPYYNELCLLFGKNRGQNKNDIDSSDNNRPLEMYEISDSKGNENNESDHEETNSHHNKKIEQFSLLKGLLGREVEADKAAADKRGRLNGELKRIPNLSLQARLRVASVIVGDSAKLDFFCSLSNEERKEWVSMLPSGPI
ncbi:hypothetical protein CTI12_AA331530 [Artemisia annua]|uniref:Myb/SANT-like domain-containing protein n=1 Tax=Artemisia annua TaxID=35608 RepID=A0A2U1MX84_ARTAN|nr:hypothetical protein CTI12_AA331530 [Artemisia annua]